MIRVEAATSGLEKMDFHDGLLIGVSKSSSSLIVRSLEAAPSICCSGKSLVLRLSITRAIELRNCANLEGMNC